MTSTVFDIQHYCIHDGPGVRTGVFLKGCPLRCRWCANPESNSPAPQLMYVKELCTGCGECIAVCPVGAITRDGEKVVRDREKCTVCGRCVSVCPASAVSLAGKTMTPEEVMEEVRLDGIFYGSEGGVTLTGGECLMQPKFCAEVLRMCKEEGIGTAIETCGFVPYEAFEAVAPYLDIALYDVKLMSTEKHKKYTGVPNELILENLKRLSNDLHIPVIARTPLIPGVNDDEENLLHMARFLKENVPTLIEVNLLPYHRLGEGKWVQLECEHAEIDTHVPEEEELAPLLALLRAEGLRAK